MILYAVRHGNTFGDDQEGGKRVFMAGRHQNIPLVASGCGQARAFAQYLEQTSVRPTAIYASHLLRTWEFATIVREHFVHRLGFTPVLRQDDRLIELDYGAWAGLTTHGDDNEVVRRFGREAWEAWQERRIFHNQPPHNWVTTESEVTRSIQSFAHDLVARHAINDVVVAVGSQGSLYYLNTLLSGPLLGLQVAERSRIKTGHFCKLVHDGAEWHVEAWDMKPSVVRAQ